MNEELGVFGSAVAVVSGANPIIAGAVGIILGTLGTWFGVKKRTDKKIERSKQEIKEILQQQLEMDEARRVRHSED